MVDPGPEVTPETVLFGFVKLDVPQHDTPVVPLIDEDLRPIVNTDETVLWEGECRLFCSAKGRKIWEFPSDAHVTVTSERLIYVCRKFDTGNLWYTGWVVAQPDVVLTAISKTRAALRRRGTVAAGQLRHEWVGRTDHRGLPHKINVMRGLTYTLRAPTGKDDHYVDVTVCGEGNESRGLSMRVKGDSMGIAELLTRTVAQHRINRRALHPLADEAVALLANLAANPAEHAKVTANAPNRVSWPMPGWIRVPGLAAVPRATPTNQPSPALPAASWLEDPTGRHELRYWDGKLWTEHVSDRQQVTTDPLNPT